MKFIETLRSILHSKKSSSWGRDLFVLSALASILFCFMLGSRPLSVPDEGRYVEISREMAVSGDYITPRLDGVKYFEKPVLFYWLESFSIKFFGLGAFTLRLWPVLFALFGCLSVYGVGRRLYDRLTGLISAVVLATNILYYSLSRAIILDMPVTVLLAAALFSFLIGTHEPLGLKRRLYLWGFYVLAALAVLTKGLIGILIPGMIIGTWLLLLGEWRMLRQIYLPSGLILFLLIAAPWHILVATVNPQFLNFYFIHEHFLRYLTKIHSRYQPMWFFIPILLVGLFPWSVFLVQSAVFSAPRSWQERHKHRDALFLFIWAGLVFIFFSVSDSKLVPYILPVFPPLSLVIGRYLAAVWENPKLSHGSIGFTVLDVIMLATGLVLIALPHVWHRSEIEHLSSVLTILGAILVIIGVATWMASKLRGVRLALPVLICGMAIFLSVVNASATHIDLHSIKSLALALKHMASPNDEIATYATYYQDLPVYLERRVTIVGWKGELEFGSTIEDTSGWMIDGATFWKRWAGRRRMFMVTRKEIFDDLRNRGREKMFVIAEDERNVLAVNREVDAQN
jgi:4-amino-4-deoxy-L-arabinose transferase-like glycosyltransferase